MGCGIKKVNDDVPGGNAAAKRAERYVGIRMLCRDVAPNRNCKILGWRSFEAGRDEDQERAALVSSTNTRVEVVGRFSWRASCLGGLFRV